MPSGRPSRGERTGHDVDVDVGCTLSAAVAEARGRGWATCGVPLVQALVHARASGVRVVPTRRGEQPVGVLQARQINEAHPRSLSARYGLGVFPLHTDGALLRPPPDLVLLEAAEPSPTGATLLFSIHPAALSRRQEDAMRRGVFSVGAGHQGFYSTVLAADGTVRFDPGCMAPLDPDARYARDWFHEAVGSADAHQWDDRAVTLVIDNRRCLHGRSDVTHHPGRTLRRLMLYWGRS